MTLPLAVSPSNPRPGFYMTTNLLRGPTSPGTQGLKALIISPPATTPGDIVVGTEIRPVFSKEDVQTAIGRGLGFLAYQILVLQDPEALVDLIACAESGGAAATGTLTFGGAVTADETWEVTIMGRAIQVSRAVGDTADTAKTAAIAKINEKVDSLFGVASSGGVGVVTFTANSKGPAGNDVTTRVKRLAGAGGTLAWGGAKLTGGTTEPDMTTALTTAQGKEYDYILTCISNAEAQSAGTSNMSRLEDHIDLLGSGSRAKMQQGIVGSTGSIASAKTGTIGRNSTIVGHLDGVNFESLPCELAAFEVGDRMRRRRRESNANRVLTKMKGIFGSADPVADDPTDAEATDALNSGVSLCGYNAQNEPILLRSITTHSQDSAGNPDKRCFDTAGVDALFDYLKDLRTAIPQEFLDPDGGQVKIVKDRTDEDEELPAGVVEERDIRNFIIRRTESFWIPKGVIHGERFREAVESGELAVEVNASDDTQVDIFLPAKAVPILAKIGLYAAKVA